jgi:hypothetical protein
MLPFDVIYKFNFYDNFITGHETARVCPSWGGNSLGPMTNEYNTSGSFNGTKMLRASRCMYTKQHTHKRIFINVMDLLKEYKHRCFHYGDKYLGKGLTYGDPDCGCSVCNEIWEK